MIQIDPPAVADRAKQVATEIRQMPITTERRPRRAATSAMNILTGTPANDAKPDTSPSGGSGPWPADKVERWAIDRLIPYARNARTHTDAQVAAIAASIKEWGWTTPALVGEDGGLIAGHARVLPTSSER